MRIGILAPIAWRTPPRKYGPWEQVCANLADGLAERGHEVYLFATGDSMTKAHLLSICPAPLGENPHMPSRSWELMHIGYALEQAEGLELDVLHNHMNYLPLPFARLVSVPVVTTLHGAAMLEADSREVYRRFADMNYISISMAEQASCPELNYVANVYNGIRLEQFDFVEREGKHLLFIGRICREKGADLAVELARRTGLPLVIAGLVPDHEQEFFETRILPAVDGERIRFVGEVGPGERNRLMGEALALLHLVRAPEPFGLVMAEAMACGTPVIGFGLGSVPEVVEHGVTGYIARDLDEAAVFVERLSAIRRRDCRERVERLFTLERMVEGYEQAYQRLHSVGVGGSGAGR
jgi:glycosyltransferase involved in cell wall biosynthesis